MQILRNHYFYLLFLCIYLFRYGTKYSKVTIYFLKLSRYFLHTYVHTIYRFFVLLAVLVLMHFHYLINFLIFSLFTFFFAHFRKIRNLSFIKNKKKKSKFNFKSNVNFLYPLSTTPLRYRKSNEAIHQKPTTAYQAFPALMSHPRRPYPTNAHKRLRPTAVRALSQRNVYCHR